MIAGKNDATGFRNREQQILKSFPAISFYSINDKMVNWKITEISIKSKNFLLESRTIIIIYRLILQLFEFETCTL